MTDGVEVAAVNSPPDSDAATADELGDGPGRQYRSTRKPSNEGLTGKACRADALVVSAARHAHSPTVAVADKRPRGVELPASLGIALRLSFGIVLSVAAVWFVLLPAIDEKPTSLQTCEVVLLGNGTVGCANAAELAAVTKPKP
jgi:hypothetical protein